MDAISANVSANLLGLGNAATPLGIQAARRMSKKTPGVASDSLCMLVVCNTASIQLIPTTVAGVRAAAGCAAPFDILPAVWLASALSVTVGDSGQQGYGTAVAAAGWRHPGTEEQDVELMVNLLMPGIIALTALWGMVRRVDVYDALVTGAGEGLGVLIRIVPSMIALLTAVYMLRASGALELAAQALGPVLELLGIPPETVALLLVRPISGSAALGVGAELISTYGPDSTIGRTAAVMLGSTETTFYTIAVYFGAAGITKTRYAVPAALCADLVGFAAAAFAVRLFFPS